MLSQQKPRRIYGTFSAAKTGKMPEMESAENRAQSGQAPTLREHADTPAKIDSKAMSNLGSWVDLTQETKETKEFRFLAANHPGANTESIYARKRIFQLC